MSSGSSSGATMFVPVLETSISGCGALSDPVGEGALPAGAPHPPAWRPWRRALANGAIHILDNMLQVLTLKHTTSNPDKP